MLDDLVKQAKLTAYAQAKNVLLEEALVSGYTEVLKKIEKGIEKLESEA